MFEDEIIGKIESDDIDVDEIVDRWRRQERD